MTLAFFPKDLQDILIGFSARENTIGRSSSRVFQYQKDEDIFYLKIVPMNEEIIRERDLLHWLKDKIPVPEVIYWQEYDGYFFLLTTGMKGEMACTFPEEKVLEPIEATVRKLAEGLLRLQAVDFSDCPYKNNLEIKLAKAQELIKTNLVDMDDWEDNNEFSSPQELLDWLILHQPQEELCFTHGDYCLPNIFLNNTGVSGFIDWGTGGIADKWQDIALCVRSLGYNLGDIDKIEKQRYLNILFTSLGMEPDWNKIEYYILLDELF